jgi:adenylosuccinate synthase
MVNEVVDCLIGLQLGSEGKGKMAAYLAEEYNAAVRSGGPQAGHTFYRGGAKYVNRQVPCGVINSECRLYLTAASTVNIDVLAKELVTHRLYPDRMMVDSHAMVVTKEHRQEEQLRLLRETIGSTLEGVGAAHAQKVMREAKLFEGFAMEDPELYFFAEILQNQLIA